MTEPDSPPEPERSETEQSEPDDPAEYGDKSWPPSNLETKSDD